MTKRTKTIGAVIGFGALWTLFVALLQSTTLTDDQLLLSSLEHAAPHDVCMAIQDPSARGYCLYLAVERLVNEDVMAAEVSCREIDIEPWRSDCLHVLAEHADVSFERQIGWCQEAGELGSSCVRHVLRRQFPEVLPIGEEAETYEHIQRMVREAFAATNGDPLLWRRASLQRHGDMVFRSSLSSRFASLGRRWRDSHQDPNEADIFAGLCGELDRDYCAWMIAQGWAHVLEGTTPDQTLVIDHVVMVELCGQPLPSAETLRDLTLRGWKSDAEEIASMAWSMLCGELGQGPRSLNEIIQAYPAVPFETPPIDHDPLVLPDASPVVSQNLPGVSPWQEGLVLGPRWTVIEVQRQPHFIRMVVASNEDRAGIELQRDVGIAPTSSSNGGWASGQWRVGNTRLLPTSQCGLHDHREVDGEAPREVMEAALAVLQRSGDAFPSQPRPRQSHGLEAWLLHLAWLMLVLGRLATMRRTARTLGAPRREWAAVVGLAVAAGVLLWMWGAPGAWHSNNHAFERLVDLRDANAPSRSNLTIVHGMAYYSLFGPLVSLWGEQVSVFLLATIVSGVTLVVWFGVSLALTDDRRVAWAMVSLLALAPAHLRVAGTESMYVATELFLALTLLAYALYLRNGLRSEFLLGAVSLFLLMQSRAEMMLLGPLFVVGLMLTHQPRWVWEHRKDRWVWGTMAGFVLASVPRLQKIAAQGRGMDTGTVMTLSPLEDPRLWVPVVLVAAMVVSHPRVRVPIRRGLSGRWWRPVGVLMVAAATVGWVWHQTLPSEGLLHSYHVFIDPRFSSPLYGVLFVVGFGLMARENWVRFVWFGVSITVALQVYVFHYDCLSTYIRAGMGLLALLCLVAAVGLAWLVNPVAERLGEGPARMLVVLVPALALVPYLPWLGQVYAKQQTWDLVAHAHSALPDGAVVGYLSDDDLRGADSDKYRVNRGRFDRYLAHPDRQVLGLDDWMAQSGVDERWFLLTPACYRPLLAKRGWFTAMWYSGSERAVTSDTDAYRLGSEPRIVMEEGMADPYVDPVCREVMGRYDLTPSWEVDLSTDVAGSVYEQWLGSSARIGLYRAREVR